MAVQSRAYLKTRFKTGDVPTQQDYIDLFDTYFSISDDEAVLADGNVTTANGNAVDLGGTATKDTELDGTNLLDLIIGGWNDPPKAWQNIVIYSKDYFYASANNNGAYFELSQTGGGASSQANMFSEGNAAIQADGVLTLDSPESEFKGQAHAYNGASVIKATTSTPTFDFSLGNDHQMDVESNVSAFATTGEVGSGNYKVWLINDATPGRTVAAPTGWTKAATSQDHDTSANAVNLYQMYTRPDGTKYYNINVQ